LPIDPGAAQQMTVRPLSHGACCVALFALTLLACGDSTGPGSLSVAGSFTAIVTMPATGTVATAVPARPTVLLKNRQGRPQAGTLVSFEVTAGAGTLSWYHATTDSAGVASAGTWTLGARAGTN